MIDTVIISGGKVEKDFALRFLEKNPKARLIAADRGLVAFKELGICPHLAVGDFDSASKEALEWVRNQNSEVICLPTHKDDTDSEAALKAAFERGAKSVALLGATGGRTDHLLANLSLLLKGRRLGGRVELLDEFCRITLAESGMEIKREELYGPYLSFFALWGEVVGLTLQGFSYPLEEKTLTGWDGGLTVSNELAGERGRVLFQGGTLLMIQSRDAALD